MKTNQSKIHFKMQFCAVAASALALLLLVALNFGEVQAQMFETDRDEQTTDGGGEYKFPDGVCLTDEARADIKINLQTSINRLQAEGRLNETFSFMVPQFIFPIVANPAVNTDFGVHGISNFVDHNFAFPNQVRDFNCGTRTYDTSAGYNHKGIDMFTFPFGFNKMDNNEAMAIAAAAGQIIFKSNGNFDRSCSFNNNNWNAVYLRHADGTVSWYGHLKNNSLTAKAVGEQVAQGEYLGIIGSSGNSTGPHLHFEIYDAANRLQDPYQGTCNLMNGTGYWQNQPAYQDSKINKLMTHSAPPAFQTCPNPDVTNEKNVFAPGTSVIVAAYFHDQAVNQVSQLSLIQPNGAVYTSWTHTSPNTYAASYWFWSRPLPADAPVGIWKFRAVFQGQTYEHSFQVRTNNFSPFDFDGDGRADVSVFRPANGAWYLQQSTAGFIGFQFGIATDKIVPADYDGDGKTDVAVYRNGVWYIQRSQLGFTGVNFGDGSDIPVPADYDGDGRSDVAVFRPSNGTWYLQQSRAGFTGIQFGTNGDQPVAADYDGDGKTDVAVYRSGVWYIQRSQLGFTGLAFGTATDQTVPADYDGDGRSDVAVFRPSNGTWYLQQSRAGFTGIQFGASTDLPTAADYDGDGRADVAVFRNGIWYLNRTTQGFTGVSFGSPGDKPIPNAFVY